MMREGLERIGLVRSWSVVGVGKRQAADPNTRSVTSGPPARLQQRLVVGAGVDHDGQACRGHDAAARGVEREAGDGHADGLHPQVAQVAHALACRAGGKETRAEEARGGERVSSGEQWYNAAGYRGVHKLCPWAPNRERHASPRAQTGAPSVRQMALMRRSGQFLRMENTEPLSSRDRYMARGRLQGRRGTDRECVYVGGRAAAGGRAGTWGQQGQSQQPQMLIRIAIAARLRNMSE